ncbi:hypothetical protein BDF14DRAFT_1769737 [Spinellus fusiger]|nr:hypothetical protein BDF14DRAFT_1769737 [Spinellus fusiger]
MSTIDDDTSTVASSQNNLSFHLSQEDSLYAQAVAVKALTEAWINERNAPELLTYKRRLVESLLDKIREKMDTVLDTVNVDPKDKFIQLVYETEVERVRYTVKSYLRTRLSKIERFTLQLLRSPNYEEIISPQEIIYARSYQELLESSNHEAFIKLMPPSQQRQDEVNGEISMVVTPNLEAPVFCRVLQDTQRIDLSVNETVDFDKGDIVLLRYRVIKDLLADGLVELI